MASLPRTNRSASRDGSVSRYPLNQISDYPEISGTLAMWVDTDPVYTDTSATVLATTQGDAIASWKDHRTGALLVQSNVSDRYGMRLDSKNTRRSLAYNYNQGNQGGFSWPTGISINARDCTIWMVVRPTEVGVDFCAFNPGPGLTDFLVDSSGLTSAKPQKYRLFGTGAANGDSNINAFCDESLVVIKAEGTNATLYRNDDSFVSTNPFASATLTGGTMLARQDGYPTRGEVFACGIIDHAITSDEFLTLKSWFSARYGRITPTKQLIVRGDSRTVGNGTTLGKNWPCVAVDTQMPVGWRLWNQALDGTDCQTVAGTITVASTSLFNGSFTKNGYGHFLGFNDLNLNSRTSIQLISDSSDVFTAMRGAGCLNIVATEPDPTGAAGWNGTKEGYRVDYNTALRPGGSLASLVDVLVDLDADSLIGDPNNTMYRNSDKIHFTQAGTNRIASLFATGILAA